MPRHFPFFACITGAISKKKGSCQLKIDQGDEKENGTETEASNHLTDDLIIESILTRLPARTLLVCCCVSKLWYNSILNDSRFAMIHNIQNKNRVSLVFHVLNVRRGDRRSIYFFSVLEREKVDIRMLLSLNSTSNIYELVGFCNGLTCLTQANATDYTRGLITVVNPSRCESFVLSYSRPLGGYTYLCHGFGFDSVSQVYKAVMVFTSQANDAFLCMVVTLGTMSWRKILTRTADIAPRSLFPGGRMVTGVSRMLCRQATLCGGGLYWMTKNKRHINSDNSTDMLLSFDLHNEKIQFIRLPTVELTRPAVGLLEFKGYPCIAHCERVTTGTNSDQGGHRRNCQADACFRCFKVHMHILEDKEKQVWTREETFNDQIPDLCRYLDTSAAAALPTRILTFSGQALLYWFSGKHLLVYNLQEKHLKAVECSRYDPSIFQRKMNKDGSRIMWADDNISCPYMDYQLRAQVENMVSLETFIPKEAKTTECRSDAELKQLFKDNLAAGWVASRRKPSTFYAFA